MANTLILKPYERRRDPGVFTRIVLGAALFFLSAFYGLMCSILPLQMLTIPALPILLIFGVILWLLPDFGTIKENWMANALVWYVGFNVLWPGYVALNAPGLPWVTPTRVLVFFAIGIFALNYATSSELRDRISSTMNSVPIARKMFWSFWALTTLSLFLSAEPLFSLSKYANNQIFWTMMFAVSCWLALREGFAMRIGRVIAWTIIVVALLSLYEYKTQSIIWLDRLPSFLKADGNLFAKLGEGESRSGTEVYRTRGTFGTSLYFAEYLGLAFPFVIHFMATAKNFRNFALLAAGATAVMAAMFYSGSRAAMLALVLTFVAYGFMTAWRLRVQRPESIAASAALYAYPVFAMVLGALVIFWRRLHVMIIGGGQHQASTDTRGVQWEMAFPKIASHPFGQGAGRSGNVLDYYNPGSENPTVDSYFLTLLLDYGILGLLTFLLLFGFMIWYGFRAYNRARTDEMLLLAPATVAMLNFIVVKAVASTETNMPIALIIMGCIMGLIGRQQALDVPNAEATALSRFAGRKKRPDPSANPARA